MAKTRLIPLGLEYPEKILHELKFQISKNLRAFARNFPLKRKITGRDLWIDIDSLTNAILVEGNVPNAGEIKGFSAPVGKRVPTRKHPVQTAYGWKTVGNRALTGSAGIGIRDTEYWGYRKMDKNLGVFGVKKGGAVRAYGLDSEGALPAYYAVSIPEWLVDEQWAEIERIIGDSLDSVMKAIAA